jgi:hypothetical protein
MGLAEAAALPSFARPSITQAFGTAIVSLIQPHKKARTKVINAKYTPGTTAHTIFFLKTLAQTRAVNAIAAAGTAAKFAFDPGNYSATQLRNAGSGPNAQGIQQGGYPSQLPIVANRASASGDYLAIATANQDYFQLNTISGAPTINSDGTMSVTLGTAAPTNGIPAGAIVFWFGISTDVHPFTGEVQPSWVTIASTQYNLDADGGEVVSSNGIYEPLLFYCANPTAAGILNSIGGVYALQ